jgi:hypothetical protein
MNDLWFKYVCACSTMFLYKSKALLSIAHCIQKGTMKVALLRGAAFQMEKCSIAVL